MTPFSDFILRLTSQLNYTCSEFTIKIIAKSQIEEILPHFFDSSPHLSEILLARNRLSRVNDGTFGLLTRLALLDLSHNSLMKLEDNVLVGMTVHHLDLGGHLIQILDMGSFYIW